MGSLFQKPGEHMITGPDGRTRADDTTAMRFTHAQATLAEPDLGFQDLDATDRRMLASWVTASRAAGIEAVEDLSVRQWPESGADTIIGVFKTGHLLASWLIVGQSGSWAVASCADGVVSPRMASLADALARVHPTEPRGVSSSVHRPEPPWGTPAAVRDRQWADPSGRD